MPKSTAEMLKALEKLIDDYLAFQRGRPDLPQGNLCELSEDELEQIVTAFQLHKSEQEAAGQTERTGSRTSGAGDSGTLSNL
jgi:hypothetical protein